MRMIRCIVRPEKEFDVVKNLEKSGFMAYTKMDVLGRGKQRGIQIGSAKYDDLAKTLFMLVVEDEEVLLSELIPQEFRFFPERGVEGERPAVQFRLGSIQGIDAPDFLDGFEGEEHPVGMGRLDGEDIEGIADLPVLAGDEGDVLPMTVAALQEILEEAREVDLLPWGKRHAPLMELAKRGEWTAPFVGREEEESVIFGRGEGEKLSEVLWRKRFRRRSEERRRRLEECEPCRQGVAVLRIRRDVDDLPRREVIGVRGKHRLRRVIRRPGHDDRSPRREELQDILVRVRTEQE